MGKASYDVPAVRKAIRLIEILSESNHPLGVSEISRRLDSNKNMSFRLLTTLENEGWIRVAEEGPKYSLTLLPFQITSQPVNRMSVKEAAHNPMHHLWEKTGESIYLGILSDNKVLYLDHLDSTKSVRVAGAIGGKYPLHCTAPGKLLLAFSDTEFIEQITADSLEKFTSRTLCDKQSLEDELKKIRRSGWALDNEEYGKGLLCLAVPLFDFKGDIVGAVGTSVTSLSFTAVSLKKNMLPELQKASREISQNLGYKHK